MKPEYAGYWLLPALRSMSTDGTTASSNWYYYVADGLSEAPTQMQLPKIKLDAPQTNQNAFTTVDSKETLQLFGADGETAWTPASTEADISRFAVEWNAVNYSKGKVWQTSINWRSLLPMATQPTRSPLLWPSGMY